ncbi:MAG: peptide ABC transporter substrate-binding protein [Pseudomonadota bacterium]
MFTCHAINLPFGSSRVSLTGLKARALTALTMLLVAALSLSGVVAAENGREKTSLRIGNGGEPQTLDPHRYNLRLEETLLTDLFLGLTAMDAEGNIIPGAASGWSVSADGLLWTFTLRPDLRWSDGRPLAAEDFVYGFRRLMDPATAASLAYFLYPLKNARAVNAGERPATDLGVRAESPTKLILELEQPYPHLPERLLYPTGFPVPAHIIETVGDSWVKPEHWVSNGAYVLEDWRPQAAVVLKANTHFHEPVAIEHVHYLPLANEQNAYNRYRAGEVDVIGGFPANELSSVQEKFAEDLRVAPLLSMIYLVFNTERPPFDDVRLRKALALVVQPDVLTDKVQRTGNFPAASFVPKLVSDYEGATARHLAAPMEDRRTQARALLAEAGYGPDNPLEITLRYYDEGDGKRTNVAIASFWRAIGVQTRLHHTELKVHFSDLREGDFDVAQAGWIGENNPAHYLDLLVSDAGNVNYGRFSNAEYDALMAEARRLPAISDRYALMRQAETLVMAEYPVVPLWSVAVKRLVNPALKGWHENHRDVHPVRYLSW